MRFRTYNISPLFLGNDGLTDAQSATLSKHMQRHSDYMKETDAKAKAKLKLTDNMRAEMDQLMDRVRQNELGNIELSDGAKTYIHEVVRQEVYGYKSSFSGNRFTEKGLQCEDSAIDLYNQVFFTQHVKSEMELSHGLVMGHPDIVDVVNGKIIDIKTSWNKSTFPLFESDGYNAQYVWQVRTYLYLMRKVTGENRWVNGEIAYMLVDTPEELVPENDCDDLHMVSDLPLNLRYTIVNVELTDQMVEHMDKRLLAAEKYAEQYKNNLINKNNV
jgi:hypothetical protein